MCGHLMSGGYTATVYNRSPEKAASLIERGAVLVNSPQEVAERSDVVFTIVGFPTDVECVILGEHGVLSGSSEGMTIVDMSTLR